MCGNRSLLNVQVGRYVLDVLDMVKVGRSVLDVLDVVKVGRSMLDVLDVVKVGRSVLDVLDMVKVGRSVLDVLVTGLRIVLFRCHVQYCLPSCRQPYSNSI